MLPATPAYVALYLFSVLQASSSRTPVQNAFYSLLYGLPASHLNKVQRVCRSKTSLSRTTLLSHNAVDVRAALATG